MLSKTLQYIFADKSTSGRIADLLNTIEQLKKSDLSEGDNAARLKGAQKQVEKLKAKFKQETGKDWTPGSSSSSSSSNWWGDSSSSRSHSSSSSSSNSHSSSSSHNSSSSWWDDFMRRERERERKREAEREAERENERREREKKKAAAFEDSEKARKNYLDTSKKYHKHFKKSLAIGGGTGAGIGGTLGYALGRKKNKRLKYTIGGAVIGGIAGAGIGAAYSHNKYSKKVDEAFKEYRNKKRYYDYSTFSSDLSQADKYHLSKVRRYHNNMKGNSITRGALLGMYGGAALGTGAGYLSGSYSRDKKRYEAAKHNELNDDLFKTDDHMNIGAGIGAIGGLALGGYLGYRSRNKWDKAHKNYVAKYKSMTPNERKQERERLIWSLRNTQ